MNVRHRNAAIAASTALVAASFAVIAGTGPAGAESVRAASTPGKLTVCYKGLGQAGRHSGTSTIQEIGGAGISAAWMAQPGRGCSSTMVDAPTRFREVRQGVGAYRLVGVAVNSDRGGAYVNARHAVSMRVDPGEHARIVFKFKKR